MPDTVAAAADALAERTGVSRHAAVVVLGSGWDAAADALGTPVAELSVAELPGFLTPVAPGHRGLVRSYDLDGVAVLAYLGRTHLYEGHGPGPVAHPLRVAAAAGARVAVLTNASGGLRPDWPPGTGALLADHLNLTSVSPLNGPQFVDLTDAWSPRLRALARAADPTLVEAVYAQLRGPSVQTVAETAMLRTLGADLVGMSTVVEAIAARAAGLELLGLSAVTTLEGTGEELDPDDVVAVAESTARRVSAVLPVVLRAMRDDALGAGPPPSRLHLRGEDSS
ncbi:MAG: purine-nucleoside phosphorylase [Sporichthyaceae bacterium]